MVRLEHVIPSGRFRLRRTDTTHSPTKAEAKHDLKEAETQTVASRAWEGCEEGRGREVMVRGY